MHIIAWSQLNIKFPTKATKSEKINIEALIYRKMLKNLYQVE